GAEENKTCRPFCGKAGDILNDLLKSVGIKREEVYIANVLKDRPPNNRDPKQEEIEACTPYLERQIEIIEPKVIVGLGNFGTKFVMSKYNLEGKIEGISQIHGEVYPANTLFGSIKIVPMYHPAVATYNANMIETLEEDFEVLKEFK
ncbi:MAG: uracil-DNA glycosylase family protein, partial [Candidatus Paceibacterota bacterium]